MRRLLSLLLLMCTPALAEDAPPMRPLNDIPVLHEEAAAAGLNSTYDGPFEYFVGGGGAAFDCNADGFPDVFLAGGKNAAKLFVNRSTQGGELKFEETTIVLDDPSLLTKVTGAYPIDIDNDGIMDLAVSRVGGNVLLKGGPKCTFSNANALWKFDPQKGWGTAFSARWEAGQKFPTLAFGYYIDRAAPGSPWGTCEDNALYRPQAGDKPDYSQRTPLTPGYCALSMLFTDWNKSGLPALRISNDRQYYRGGQEQLWRMEPDKTPKLFGPADGWRKLVIFGMGIAEGDIDGDGYPEYALTSMGDTMLQTLDGEAKGEAPVYRDVAFDRGATAHRPYAGGDLKPSTGWHSEFADFNNDGLADLFIAKGNVEQMPDFAAFDPNNLLLGQWNGKFAEAGEAAGIALKRKGRGALIDDFNLDGMVDLLVINRGQPATLFRNLGTKRDDGGTMPMGSWVEIRLSQKGDNRDAVGARINIKTGTRVQTRMVEIGGGHASGHIGFVPVGLGTAERAEIRVTWPDGEESAPYRVFSGQFVVIERGAKGAAYWYPGR